MHSTEFTTPLSKPLSLSQIASRLNCDKSLLQCRRSLDCRSREPIYRYRAEIYEEGELPLALHYQDVHDAPAVAVVGSGPAGMFAALELLRLGLKPIVLERGKPVDERKRDLALLCREGRLHPDSNYCYGEGGAGTFSDGKLYTRSTKRGDNRAVLEQLVFFGADEDILLDSHPHIGSDRLPKIVGNIRKCVIGHGGEYHFGCRVVDFSREGRDWTLHCANGLSFNACAVILATGHSGRDVYELLSSKGIVLQAKGFALGVRVELPQALINEAQYKGHWRPGMPAAEFSFVRQVQGRGVFSFCMCPGGVLVPSSTEEGTVVLNGMSASARSSRWANSGVVVQIEAEDIEGDSPLRLLDFQQEVERSMFRLAKAQSPHSHPFAAPAQRMVDFCRGRLSADLPASSYPPGLVSADLGAALPALVSKRLKAALPDVNIRGFYSNDSLLAGVESRTSSPVRIVRDNTTLQCLGYQGIYPCGEGAGYSGGIVSSAIDGIRAARALASEF